MFLLFNFWTLLNTNTWKHFKHKHMDCNHKILGSCYIKIWYNIQQYKTYWFLLHSYLFEWEKHIIQLTRMHILGDMFYHIIQLTRMPILWDIFSHIIQLTRMHFLAVIFFQEINFTRKVFVKMSGPTNEWNQTALCWLMPTCAEKTIW